MRSRPSRLGVTALGAALITLSLAPTPTPRDRVAPQDPAGRAGEFVLEAGAHSVRELLDSAAKFLKRNYVYSEVEMANFADPSINLHNRLTLDAVGCEEVVCQLVFTCGFAMLPVDEQRGIYEFIHMSGPRRSEMGSRSLALTPEQALRKRKLLGLPALVSLPLTHISARWAQNQLRAFFAVAGGAGAGGLTIGAAGDALLLQGFVHHVANAIEIVQKVDVEQREPASDFNEWRDTINRRLKAIEKSLR